MIQASNLSQHYVPFERPTGFPFNSPGYDSFAANGLRCEDLVGSLVRFSDASTATYFEVVDSEGKLYDQLDLDDKEITTAVHRRLDDPCSSLRIIVIPQDEKTRRRAFMISRHAFEVIFNAIRIPVRFLEIMPNNNGCYLARATYADNGVIESFHIMIKLPSSFLNSTIYFRYDLSTGRSVCLLMGNRTQGVVSALQQTFASQGPDNTRSNPRPASPFQILNIVMSEYVALMEPERQFLDVRVRELEAKTGMSAHIFDDSQRAIADEYSALQKDLHVCEGLLAFFERTTQFQVGLTEWLQAQHAALNEIRFGTCQIIKMTPAGRPIEEEVVASSLSLCTSFSRERLEQVRTLRNRIQIQLSVVANIIAQNDNRTNISIAEASRRIAFETKRDSDAMKTIAALTMVFLPATFVATLFGMVFFTTESSSGSGFRVNSLWWIYLAVTIPLTMLTVGVWLGWLWWVRRRRVKDEEEMGLKEKSQ